MRGLQPVEKLQSLRASGTCLALYTTSQAFSPNPTLGALASLIDIHIYRSEAKDPADVVRVEVRLRGRTTALEGLRTY